MRVGAPFSEKDVQIISSKFDEFVHFFYIFCQILNKILNRKKDID